MQWFYKILLRHAKRKALIEAQHNLLFIERNRRTELDYNVPKARREMAKERNKPNASEEVIERLSREIAEAEAVKGEYETTQSLVKELPLYIKQI